MLVLWLMASLSLGRVVVVVVEVDVVVVEVDVVEVGGTPCRACQTRESVVDEGTHRCCQYRMCKDRDHHEPCELRSVGGAKKILRLTVGFRRWFQSREKKIFQLWWRGRDGRRRCLLK